MSCKSKFNGHNKCRGKKIFKPNISEKSTDYPQLNQKFGYVERDTIVSANHENTVITLVERLYKGIITLKLEKRKAADIKKIKLYSYNQLNKIQNPYKYL